MLTDSGETSNVESLNSLLCKYANKRDSYKYVNFNYSNYFTMISLFNVPSISFNKLRNIKCDEGCFRFDSFSVLYSPCRWLAMYIRTLVAILDFNHNVQRPNKQVNGETVYKMKVNYV